MYAYVLCRSIYVYMYVCMYVWRYVYMYVCICLYVYIRAVPDIRLYPVSGRIIRYPVSQLYGIVLNPTISNCCLQGGIKFRLLYNSGLVDYYSILVDLFYSCRLLFYFDKWRLLMCSLICIEWGIGYDKKWTIRTSLLYVTDSQPVDHSP